MIECPSDGTAVPASDRELLERFLRGGDETAFAGLVRRHGPMVQAVCRRVLHNAHDAEDACQAAFLVLGRKAASIRNRESVAAWLHGVAFRVAVRLRRDVHRRRAHEEPAADVAAPDRSGELTWQEVRAALDEELNALPERYRAPLVLCYLEGRTRDEAARQLGWSLNSLRGRLERARAQLRARLLRRGLGLSAAWLTAALTPAAKGMKAGRVGAASVSARAAALAEEVVKAMTPSKVSLAAWVLLTVGVLGAGAGVLTRQGRDGVRETVVAAARPAAQAEDERLRKEVEQLRKQNEELKRLLLEVGKKVTALEARLPAPPQPTREVHFQGKPTSFWLEMLHDRDLDFHITALKALAAIGREDVRAVPALLAELKHAHAEVRAEVVIELLFTVGDPKTLPAVVEHLQDPSAYVRERTVNALGVAGLPFLLKALKDAKDRVRLAAARALGSLGRKARDAVPALTHALQDPNEKVREAARRALDRINAP